MVTTDTPVRRMVHDTGADYWRLWSVGLAVFTVRWLETVAVGVVVYQRTGSAFVVAMMTMLRLLPMGLFGVFLGALAERFDRRATLIGVVLLVGEVVGRQHMSTAMSLDVGANNASRMVGPTLGGLLLASIGIEGPFALSVLLYLGALAAALTVRSRIPVSAGGSAVLARIAEGLTIVRGDRKLIGTLIVTVIFNVFAWPFTSMIPVIGRDRLLLGPEGVGILAGLDGIGAFAGAMMLALWLRPHWYGRAYVGGVVLYMLMLILFAVVTTPAIAGMALLLTGIGGAGFSTMQATLVYLAAPPEMRSRILGVLSVCIGTGPIGFVCLLWLADRIGAQHATAATGVVGLCALAATWRFWRGI